MAGHYILANLSRHGLRHYLRFHFRRALSPADACLTRRPAPKGSDARCAFPIIATTVRPTSVALRSTRPLSLLRQPISMLSDLPHYFECTHGSRIAKKFLSPSLPCNTHRWFSRRRHPASLRRGLWIRAKFFMRPKSWPRSPVCA